MIDEFENGAWYSDRPGAQQPQADRPGRRARSLHRRQVANITVDRWQVDCGGCVGEQTFHVESNNVTVRNSEHQQQRRRAA